MSTVNVGVTSSRESSHHVRLNRMEYAGLEGTSVEVVPDCPLLAMTMSSVKPSSVETLMATPWLSGDELVWRESNVATGCW